MLNIIFIYIGFAVLYLVNRSSNDFELSIAELPDDNSSCISNSG